MVIIWSDWWVCCFVVKWFFVAEGKILARKKVWNLVVYFSMTDM